MKNIGSVLVIVGPAGSGKSTLAAYAAKRLGWKLIEEDRYWVEHEWGSGTRTEEQEAIIQEEVSRDIIELCRSGKSVVIEFILYKNPPNPLTNYSEKLQEAGIDYTVVALKPSLDAIMERQKARGRASDIERAAENRDHARNQINCLNEDYIKGSTLDTTNLSVEDTFETVAEKL